MGYYSSNAYRDLKWFEKMQKEADVGKRDFKQIEKIHKKNKAKKRKENDMGVKKKITEEDIKRLIDDMEYLKRLLGE